MPIQWTKLWAGSDDGTIVGGLDLKNIQNDLSSVLTTSDVGSTADIIVHDNLVLVYEDQVLFA